MFPYFFSTVLMLVQQGNSNYPLYFPGFGGDDDGDHGGGWSGDVYGDRSLGGDISAAAVGYNVSGLMDDQS